MGMFDTVKFKCPECNGIIAKQSKGGPCRLKTYNASRAPADVLGYIDGKLIRCENCGNSFQIRVEAKAYLDTPDIDDDDDDAEDY